jgi:hypothetical protein
MLYAHAEQSVDDLCGSGGVGRDSLSFVLAQCAGLPFALAIAGRAIAESVGTFSGQTAVGSSREFEAELRRSANYPLIASNLVLSRGKYSTVALLLATSLKAAGDWDGRRATNDAISVEQMYAALSVIEK